MTVVHAQVTQLFSGYVVAALQQYASNPGANWRAKDSAIYLVVALAVQGRTAAQDASATNQLVNIQDFFNQARCPAQLVEATVLDYWQWLHGPEGSTAWRSAGA